MRLVSGLLVVFFAASSLAALPGSAAAAGAVTAGSPSGSFIRSGQWLSPGESLRSTDHRFRLIMRRSGDLVVVAADGQRQWSSGTTGHDATARLLPGGALVIDSATGGRLWSSGSGGHRQQDDRLTMHSGGALTIRGGGRSLWTNHLGSRCRSSLPRRAIIVSIRLQHLWACNHGRLVRSTPVTTGASAKGWITPTGTWHVDAKERDVDLRGPSWDDHVHFWMPYDGPFGLHDALWQKFREGSAKYKLHGSHGCTHLPLKEMRRLYAWARIGTEVSIHR